jgi:hemerythrin-like domain-containing protein
LLFPRLRDRGLQDGEGCVDTLLAEHSETAAAFARMVSAAEAYEHGDRGAATSWSLATRQYVSALRRHIHREEEVLFPAAERLLSDDDHRELFGQFSRADSNAKLAGLDEVLEDFERIAAAVAR